MGKIQIDHTGSGGGITLSSDGTNLLVGGSAVGGGDVVDDTSPQLGGTLDTNGNLIQFGDSSSATDDRLQFGASQDLEIYHNGSNSFIDNNTGNIYIRQFADDLNVFIQSDNGSGSWTNYFVAQGSTGEAQLYHYGSEKLATKSTGVDITGTVTDDGAIHDGDVTFTGASYSATWDKSENHLKFNDNATLRLGNASDLELYHNGSNSVIGNYTGTFFIVQYADDGNIIIRSDDGSGGVTDYFKGEGATGEAHLLYYGTEKLNTISQGVYIAGNIILTGTVDGRDVNADGQKLDGIEASADVTDAANVTAAGALMDSELTNLAAVKAIDQGLTTSSNVQFNNVTVDGNLTVGGTTTTINSTTVTVDDPIFTLGGDTAPTSDDNKDRGIEFRWHNGSAAKVGFFGFDDSAGKFTFIPDATNTSEVFSGTAGTIVANLEGTIQTAAQTNITSLGTLSSLSVTGAISGGSLDIDNIAINGGTITAQAGSMTLSGNVDVSNGLDVTGNITVTGTVDGRDIATDGTKLDGIATGADVTPAWVPASDPSYLTSSITSTVNLSDNTTLTFGAGNDLSITHNGSDSVITDAGTGALRLRGSEIYLENSTGTESGLSFFSNGSVNLFYNNATKLTTTNAGLTMTGYLRHNGATSGGLEGFDASVVTYRNYTTRTLVSSTSASPIVSVPYTGASVNFRSIEATIQVKNTSTGAREIQKVMATTDGTNAYVTNYGEVSTTGSSLADYTVDLLSSNLRILATQGSTTQHEYKVHAILFTD